MRKTKRVWRTKDGELVRIKDMTDNHLKNTIRMLERNAKIQEWNAINEGEKLLCCLQGEMAIDDVERKLQVIEEYGLSPYDLYEEYKYLKKEEERRLNKFNPRFA